MQNNTTKKTPIEVFEKQEYQDFYNEKNLKNIINNIGDPFFIKDDQSIIILVNDSFCKLFDLDRKHIIGKTLAEDVSPDEQEWFLKIDKQVLASGIESVVEETLTVRDKEAKTISTRKTRYIDANNKKYLIGVIRDITERKKAELQLKETLSHNKLAVDISKLGVWQLNVDSGELLWNDRHLEFYGITRDDFSNDLDGWSKQLHPEDKEYAVNSFKKVFENESIYDLNFRIIRPNGEIRFLSASAAPIVINNKLVKIIGVNRDITSRKTSERNLKDALSSLNLAVNSAKLGVWSLEIKTGELDWNDRLFEIYGILPSEFDYSQESFQNMVHPEDLSLISEGFSDISQNKSIPDFEFRIIRPDNEIRYIAGSAAPIFVDGKLEKMIGINRDITDSKKSEKRLEEALVQLTELKQQIEAENIYLKEELKLVEGFDDIVGSDKSLKKVLKQVERVAKTDTTVLIMGETGTGKELIAKAIHSKSDRNDKPLVKVNCSAIPEELIESEFFGHEAGAFTSAIKRKIGRFELANGGTIFLDEIGDLPLSMQTRLLRVLQEMEFERVGGETTIKVDVRVITATNRNLKEEVENGNFRQDLYYRLNVFPVVCPPLRKRTEDIPSLVNHFVNKFGTKINKQIKAVHQNSLERLKRYNWPGNVRELEHVIERAVILNNGEQLRLGSWFMDSGNSNKPLADGFASLETVERDYIIKVLEETNWRIRGKNGASEILGLKPTTLESRMKKMNIMR